MRRWFPGTSLFGAVGSSPTPVIFWHSYTMYCFLYFEHLHMVSPTTIHAIDHKRYRQDGRVVWGVGIRALDTSMAWVRVPFLSLCWYPIQSIVSFILKNRHMVSSTIIYAIDHKTYRQDCREEWGAGFRHQSLRWRRVESYSYDLVDIPKEIIVSIILNTCTWCHLPLSMLLTSKQTGRMAVWSKVLV